MKEFRYTIRDELGLHARPASLRVKKAGDLSSRRGVVKKGRKVDARRLFGVMSLGIRCGDAIKFKLEGPKEEEEAELLKRFCENTF